MSRSTFFRQSGWMMIATLLGGLCMFGVHPFARKIPESEYGIFGTMVAVLYVISIPALGLQMVFAQQSAAAMTPQDKRRLCGTVRGVLLGTFVIWAVLCLAALALEDTIVARWKLSNPAALWLTLVVGLAAVWQPMFGGLLQGSQKFLWFGLATVFNGAGRLLGVAVVVLVFQGYAAGMVIGILLGTGLSLIIYIWHSRHAWLGSAMAVDWRPWLAKVIPLTLGNGAFLFMFSADPMFVQAYFEEETGFYVAAGTLARALVTFTVPIVWVMFPKVVRSVALSEKTDVMWLTLALTGLLASCGALALSVIAPWLLTLVYGGDYLAAVPILRWFAWSMVPLALANVLLNNLLAKNHFKMVPWLIAVAALYTFALLNYHDSFLEVVRVLGTFNLLFLGVLLFFSWRHRDINRSP